MTTVQGRLGIMNWTSSAFEKGRLTTAWIGYDILGLKYGVGDTGLVFKGYYDGCIRAALETASCCNE